MAGNLAPNRIAPLDGAGPVVERPLIRVGETGAVASTIEVPASLAARGGRR